MRKVVITGMGAATPLGTGVKKNTAALMQGLSGVAPFLSYPEYNLPVKIAGEVKDFDLDAAVPKKEQKKTTRFTHLALACAKEAIHNSGLNFSESESLRQNTGVLVGVGMGALPVIEDMTLKIKAGLRPSPFFIPSVIANAAAGQISIQWGLKGGNFSTISACASGAHSLGEAYRWIQENRYEVMIAGGAESALSPLSFQGFSAMRALSTRNEEPQKASRPYDKDRSGFVMSEGACIFVLESETHARKRKAPIHAEVKGYGTSSDAFHIAAPEPEGQGARLAMSQALQDAQIPKENIDCINAHGTSTPAGDLAEAKAIASLFKEHGQKKLLISSTKSMTGHTLGAAGAIEALFSVLSLQEQCVPPTINLDSPDTALPPLNIIAHQARPAPLLRVLNNSFGFGGSNVCLIFQKYGG